MQEGLGALKKVEDFRAIAEKVEQQLGTETLRNMHCHFSAIEFTVKEKKNIIHLTRKGMDLTFDCWLR